MRDDRELEAVEGVSLTVRGGEIVAPGRGGRQRPARAGGGDRRPARRRPRGASRSAAMRSAARGVRATCDAGVAHIPRTASCAGWCSTSHWRRTFACASTAPRAAVARRGRLERRADINSRARSLLQEYDVRGGSEATLAGSLSGGNQQKVVHRARDRQQPAAADRSSAHARTGRGGDRVRPQPPRGRARSRVAGSCWCRSSPRRCARSPTASS